MNRLDEDTVRDAAHDLNNLLTAIMGAAGTALERPGLSPETRQDLEIVLEAAQTGGALVASLRGGSARTRKVLNAADLPRSLARLLSHRSDHAIVVDIQQNGLQIRADPVTLRRALMNLALNAHQAMPGPGTVTLSVRRLEVTAPIPGVAGPVPPGTYVALGVADTGGGIPPDLISRIFERGFTTRAGTGGSGLGLASVLETVRRDNGFVTVESQEGRGSRFEILFPPVDRPPAEPVAPSRPVPERKGHVLLVEDDGLVRRIAGRLLTRAGWTVHAAETAEDALDLLPNPPEGYSLLITDLALPGIDGMELARRARNLLPDLRILLCTGYTAPAAEEGPGGIAFLRKPFSNDEFLEAVARLVDVA